MSVTGDSPRVFASVYNFVQAGRQKFLHLYCNSVAPQNCKRVNTKRFMQLHTRTLL